MDSDELLLEVAGALADGIAVDWELAAQSITDAEGRRLLDELRFISELMRTARGGSSEASTAASSWTRRQTPAASSQTQPTPGEFWGPLKVIEQVGRGTFGDVYRAWDSRLDREVALKILRRRERDDRAQPSTVIEEGRLLARVRHPNVVTVYGAERVNGRVGVWMEFVHGKTLEQELREQGPFEVDRVIRIGIALSEALSTVHRAGLVHRDVKTHNVICDREGRMVLTDFGTGCEIDETSDDHTRELAGTPVCVAPEVLAGQAASPRADVYSLGVLLYHLVTGSYPVRGRSLREIREAHAHGTRTPLAAARPDLPPAFVRCVDRALDPHPEERHDSADAMRAELVSLGPPVPEDGAHAAIDASHERRGRAWARSRHWGVAAIALAVMGGVSLWRAVGSDGGGSRGESMPAVINPEIELVEVVTLAEHGRLEEAYERTLRTRAAVPQSPAAASAATYTLTYAGFVEEAVRAFEAVLAADPDYIRHNGWWAPTALLYQRDFDRFLHMIRGLDTPSFRLYRGLAEAERGPRANAVPHLVGDESGAASAFNRLAEALHAGLTGHAHAAAMVRSVADQRRAAGDVDGEVTFKQAQILSVAGDAPSALAMLDEAVAQGFVCVTCFETSSLLDPVRALPGYRRVRERAVARHRAFGRRFGLAGQPGLELRAP